MNQNDMSKDELISAGAIIFYNGKVLVLANGKGEKCFPKGRVNEGEDLSQAAVREAKEEAGVLSETCEKIGVEVRYSDAIKKTKYIHWFKAIFLGPSVQRLEKHESFTAGWMNVEEAKDCLSFDGEQKIFNSCIQELKDN